MGNTFTSDGNSSGVKTSLVSRQPRSIDSTGRALAAREPVGLLLESSEAPLAVTDPDACHLCGKSAWTDRAGYGFLVNPCDKCERPICEACCECDYDLVGDPEAFTCTQWQCSGECQPEPSADYQHQFDQSRDEIVERLISRLEAIDLAYGLAPAYNYSTLRRQGHPPAIITTIDSTISPDTFATRTLRKVA